MPIAIKPNKSARVRALKAANPELGPKELARMAGVDSSLARAALEHGELRKRAKTRMPFDGRR